MSKLKDVAPITPANPQGSKEPRVGIFWSVPQLRDRTLVTDATTLGEAEPYGDFLTHPRGHYDVWESWRRLGPEGLMRRGLPTEIAWHEYEHFPRGRIVYHIPSHHFILYADRTLHTRPICDRIAMTFALRQGSYILKSDEHYRTRQ